MECVSIWPRIPIFLSYYLDYTGKIIGDYRSNKHFSKSFTWEILSKKNLYLFSKNTCILLIYKTYLIKCCIGVWSDKCLIDEKTYKVLLWNVNIQFDIDLSKHLMYQIIFFGFTGKKGLGCFKIANRITNKL